MAQCSIRRVHKPKVHDSILVLINSFHAQERGFSSIVNVLNEYPAHGQRTNVLNAKGCRASGGTLFMLPRKSGP